MKSLFYFQGPETQWEIFSDTHENALKELEKLMNWDTIIVPIRLKFVTQNYSCPKCSCQATECNANC